jgi:hypothetical protein
MLQPRFKIRNTSRATVTVRVAKTTCACANAKLLKTTLEPNEQTELSVDWRLREGTGRSEFAVLVVSEPRGLLRLAGSVDICDLIMLDKNEISLGDIRPGETKTGQVEIKPWPGEMLSDAMCAHNPDMFPEFQIAEKNRTTAAMVVTGSVTGRPGLGQKVYKLAIRTGSTIQPVVEVPVSARHLELYEARPSVVLLDGTDTAKFVKLVSNASLPVAIERIAIDDESIISAIASGGESSGDTVRLQRRQQHKSDTEVIGSVRVFVVGHTPPIVIRYICL